MMVVQTDQVKMTLSGSAILKGITLQAPEGRFVGVIGPNGSGKSTFLKCIYRVLKPSGGAVFLEGRPLGEWTVRESAKKVAVVAQHNYYNFDFSVQDVVLMGRAPHKRVLEKDTEEDYEIVRNALETVGMAAFGERSFSTLSGGEQQRVILARALAQQTPCLILDEPTNHLDIKNQLEMMDIVRGLNRTVISAIHDLNIAAMYCDELYAMKEGRIVGSGAPQDILTESFIRQVYEIDVKVVTGGDGQLHILYHPRSKTLAQ
jgi:iron complex transport system ATP-binding protein